MRSVQIKNVPDDVHHVLRRRAAESGQSLQEYLLVRLTAEARQETLDEVLDRAGGRAGGSVPLGTAAQVLRAERERA
ncbi:MAG TPA: hypothetical protein VFP78_16905 [Solirubrobacteraceae bacterium]|nr:hypothetical protein [Solirubrobacteraceae bacterium]